MDDDKLDLDEDIALEGSPVVKMSLLIILQMVQSRRPELRIDRGIVEGIEKILPNLMNRFKIMAGLNPFFYSERARGTFQIRTRAGTHVFEVETHDEAYEPYLMIRRLSRWR